MTVPPYGTFPEGLPVCLPLRMGGGGGQRISREIPERNDETAAALQTKNVPDVARRDSHLPRSGTGIAEPVMHQLRQLQQENPKRRVRALFRNPSTLLSLGFLLRGTHSLPGVWPR